MTLPLFVRLAGARVVAVGAGPVAASKVLPLVDEGAEVVVVAPDADPALRDAARDGRLTWRARPWSDGDLDGALLVVAATASAEVNAAVAEAAARRATLCVRVDRAGDGTADFAAALRRGALTLAVSTSGRAPALARHLRAELESAYGPEWAAAVDLYAALRADPALSGLDDRARRARWRALPHADILALLRSGRAVDAQRLAQACLSSSSD